MDVSDIHDGVLYYGLLTVVMPMASAYSLRDRKTAAADAYHFDGTGPRSYGTLLEVDTHDTKNQMLPFLLE